MSLLATEATVSAETPSVPLTSTPIQAPFSAKAALGLITLGAAGTLNPAEPLAALAGAPVALATLGGALLLTAPALLVLHQLGRLEAAPEALALSVTRAAGRAGELALGLTPAMLFFSLTSSAGPFLLGLFLLGTALAVLAGAWQDLVDAETQTKGERSAMLRGAAMQGLALLWVGLTALVGLRLAFATFPA